MAGTRQQVVALIYLLASSLVLNFAVSFLYVTGMNYDQN